MLEIQGKLIEEPILDILYDLRRDLVKRNINKLNDIIVKGPNALVTCPNHKNGLETHPSCYVRLDEGVSDKGTEVKEGTVYCFTCKYNVPFQVFISNCFDYDDNGKFGESWLLEPQPRRKSLPIAECAPPGRRAGGGCISCRTPAWKWRRG